MRAPVVLFRRRLGWFLAHQLMQPVSLSRLDRDSNDLRGGVLPVLWRNCQRFWLIDNRNHCGTALYFRHSESLLAGCSRRPEADCELSTCLPLQVAVAFEYDLR